MTSTTENRPEAGASKWHPLYYIAKEGGGMANEKNLKDLRERTTEEQRAIARKGGLASGEARRKKRSMMDSIKLIMNLGVDEKTAAMLQRFGIEASDLTIMSAVNFAMAMKAMRGDVKAAEYLARYSGGDPRDILEREKYKHSVKLEEKGGNVVDDWINSIPDNKEDSGGGDDGKS